MSLSTKRKTMKKIMFSREVPPKLINNPDEYSILPIKEALQGPKYKAKSQAKNAPTIHAAEAKENPQFPNLKSPPNLQKDNNLSSEMINNEEVSITSRQFLMPAKVTPKAIKNNKLSASSLLSNPHKTLRKLSEKKFTNNSKPNLMLSFKIGRKWKTKRSKT
jgi:hypothetical protein